MGCIGEELGMADWFAAPIGIPIVLGNKPPSPKVVQSRKGLQERL